MKKAIRPAIFKWRQTEPELILCAVRWYLRYSLSFRDVEELLRERGLEADHTTIWRWVQRYGPELEERLLVDPARDGHDEELQHVGKRRHTGRAEQRLSAVTNVATRRASSVESARRTASIGFLDSTTAGPTPTVSSWTSAGAASPRTTPPSNHSTGGSGRNV